ncbi:DUF2142 domain-containing protein [Enterococcus asini]|uniref:DUF2142 domain-containing protein n=1 Tax=Enterococcus asini TaxID=57732 RepID=UPI0028904CBF|nr:DUF2142 domain-containing protein [Enterococcus asini]MDT2756590.1 DUF2142 domain-containing protein [Enterococcus asini]
MERRQANLNKSFFNLKLVIAILLSLLLALVMAIVPGNIAFFQSGNLDVSPSVVESVGFTEIQGNYQLDSGSNSATLKIDLDGIKASKLFIVNEQNTAYQLRFSIAFDSDEAKSYEMSANQRILSIPRDAHQAIISIDNSESKTGMLSIHAKSYFKFNKILFTIFFLSGVVFYVGHYFLKKNRYDWFALIILLFFGISTAILLPPTKGLDEYQHFLKALSLAEGNFFFENGDKVLVPEKINDLNKFELRGTYSNYEEFSAYYATLTKDDYTNRSLVPIESTASSYLFIPYIFEAIGIFIGNLLSVNVLWLLWLARISNVIAYAVCSFFAIRLLPRSKLLLVTLCLQPVMLYLGGTAGFDSVMLGFLYLGLTQIYNVRMKAKVLSIREFLIIAVSFCFVIMAKVSYAPILLFCFLLKKENFSSIRRRILYSVFISLLLFLVAVTTYGYASVIGLDQWRMPGVDTSLQLKYILTNPLKYLNVLVAYFSDNTLFFYENIFGALGYLPQLKSSLNFFNSLLLLFLAIFGMTAVEQKDDKNYLIASERLITVFSLICMAGLTATALYMSFTAVGSDTIAGYQPRYLLPLVFPGMMCLANKKIRSDFNYMTIREITFAWIMIILVSFMWHSILVPFYC